MEVALDAAVDELPKDKLRYMMGVGMPDDLTMATARGVDLFDCVLPTRLGRSNTTLVPGGVLKMRNQQYAEDQRPLQEGCSCYACRHHSRAYIRHLAVAKEMLGGILQSIHNIHFLQQHMQAIRDRVPVTA